jgi:hypothetical protein
MTKKDGDKLRAIRKELGEMALTYDGESLTSQFLWEMKSRLGMFLAGHEREAAAGLLNKDATDPLDTVARRS